MRPASFAFFLLLSAAVVGRAQAAGVDPSAATPVQREQAQSRFVKGREFSHAKKYEQALAEYRASFDIVASPNTRLSIARTLRDMGRIVEAYVEFGRAIVEAAELSRIDSRYAKAHDAATKERSQLESKVGFVVVRIANAEPESKFFVANEEIRRAAWNEPAPVMPGETELRIETAGRRPVVQTVTLNAGQHANVDLDVRSGDVIAPPAPVAQVEEKPETRPLPLRTYAYVAGGVGVAGLATFAVAGLMAKSTHDDLSSRCAGGCPGDSQIGTGRTEQTIANIGLVVGAVGIATGVTLFVLSTPKNGSPSAATSAAVVVSPNYLGIRGSL